MCDALNHRSTSRLLSDKIGTTALNTGRPRMRKIKWDILFSPAIAWAAGNGSEWHPSVRPSDVTMNANHISCASSNFITRLISGN